MSDSLPEDVRRLVDERAEARAQRDWARADALRDMLRGMGWDPVDTPGGSTVRAVLPPSDAALDADDSLLEEPATFDASLVTILEDHPQDLERLADALRANAPSVACELVVVANAPAREADAGAALADLSATLLSTRARLGWADAANLGLRRTRGAVAVLLDGSVEPTGDFLPPLLAPFADGAVGLAGPWGVTSPDARHFADAPAGEVDAVLGYCLAIRREALREVGGFDHRFRYYRNADLDLSFAVRDRGWRAVGVDELPLIRHEHRGWTSLPDDERERLSRRNFYRFLDHWGRRPDLLLRPGEQR